MSVVAAGSLSAAFYSTIFPAETPQIFSALDVRSGRIVAEVEAGRGGMLQAASEAVGPSGRVFATESDPKLLAELRKKVADRKLSNVTVIEASDKSSNLPENCCDAVFMRSAYRHFSAPADMNASILRGLRPGGLMAVDELPPSRALTWSTRLKRHTDYGIAEEDVKKDVTAAGFVFAGKIPNWAGECSYGLVFRR